MHPLRSALDVAPLRAEPRLDAEQVTQALPGEPLTVVVIAGAWARVRTAYDYPGWIRVDELGGDPDPAWLPPAHEGSAIEEARRYLGAPYEWGGMTERGIDCSGLVHMAYRGLGRLVPRDAWQQEAAGREVAEPEAGDLGTYGTDVGSHRVLARRRLDPARRRTRRRPRRPRGGRADGVPRATAAIRAVLVPGKAEERHAAGDERSARKASRADALA